jgi:hypothetical protein
VYTPDTDPWVELHVIPRLPADAADIETKLCVYRNPDNLSELRASHMIAAFVRDYVRAYPAVPADALREAMFAYFGGRDTLAAYWVDPDATFADALARAVEMDLVVDIPDTTTGGRLYGVGFEQQR